MKQITYVNNSIVFGATTLKDTSVPENNNMALHVCLDQKKVMINRYQLSQELNQPLSNWALPWQKHTANIYEVTQKDKQKGAAAQCLCGGSFFACGGLDKNDIK